MCGGAEAGQCLGMPRASRGQWRGGQDRVSDREGLKPRQPGHDKAGQGQPAHTCSSGWSILPEASGGPPAPKMSQRQPLWSPGITLPGGNSGCTHRTATHRAPHRAMWRRGQSLGTPPSPPFHRETAPKRIVWEAGGHPKPSLSLAPAPCQVAPGCQMDPVQPVPPLLSPARPLLEL